MQTFAGSDRGLVRPRNEDAFVLYVPEDEEIRQSKGVLAVVADGVGGRLAGTKPAKWR